MNKSASLRAVIEGALPYLTSNPDRLLMFIENGQIAAGLGGPSFEYRYTVTIVLCDFALHPDTIIIPLLEWIKVHQPSLLQNPDTAREAIKFESEIINHTTIDLRLQIKLNERVQATRDGATIKATHLGEPEVGDYPPVERVLIYHDGELVDDSAAA